MLLVGGDPGFLQIAREGARLAFPSSLPEAVPNLAEARRRPSVGPIELLALERAGDCPEAARETDEEALPRWAVIVFGGKEAEGALARIPAEEWGAKETARVFRLAAALQALRRENQRLRGDLASIGVRGVHDLRAPLGAVATGAQFLHELLATDSSPHASLTRPIEDSAGEMARLLQDLSLVTLASSSPPALEAMPMGPAVWAALQSQERRLAALGLAIEQPAQWPEVNGDPHWLTAVWRMLLRTSLGSSAPRRLVLGWERCGSRLCFWVERSPGEAEAGPDPFHPFHRLHETNAPRGLELPIVRRLVELQGGACERRCQAGSARWQFSLPAPS